MKVRQGEAEAVRRVLEFGERFGYGNMIAHLQTAWARMLMEKYGMSEEQARDGALGKGYPFKLQDDILANGEWDETGERYKGEKT